MLGFRVWYVETKEMIYDGYFAYEQTGQLMWRCIVERDPKYIPMQSTGIQDDLGKMIFEKDILRSVSNGKVFHVLDFHSFIRNHVNNIIDMTRSQDRSPASYMRKYINNISLPCQVIGNMYEHPELLEKLK